MTSLLELSHRFFDEVWNQADRDAIFRWMKPDMKATGVVPASGLSPEEFAGFHDAINARMKDLRIDIERGVEQDPWIALLCTVTANCRETGAPVRFSFQAMVRFEDGLLAEGHNDVDFITMFEALGDMPKDAAARLMAGEKLTFVD